MSDSPYRPLEGDPDLLAAKARHYQSIGNAIARSVNTLDAIGKGDAMTSQAVDKLRESAKSVGDDIDKAKERYQKTAGALLTYSAALRTAQDHATTAIQHINAKQSAAHAAHTQAAHASTAVDDADDADKSDAQKKADQAQDAAGDADADLRAAQNEWHHALEEKNQAAQAAITVIVDVVDKHNNGLKDGWWDDWGSTLFDILKTICDWAGVLAIFLAWVPILGEILLVLAAIGAVLDLIDAIIKVVQGKGSFWDVAFAAVGVVLTLCGGKLIEMAVKGARGMAVVKAANAIRSEGGNVRTGMRIVQEARTGTSDYMTLRNATKASRELTDAISSPKGALKAAGHAFTDSFARPHAGAFAADGFKGVVKEMGEEMVQGLKHPIIGQDLAAAHTVLSHSPAAVAGAGHVVSTVTAIKTGETLFHVADNAHKAYDGAMDNIENGKAESPGNVVGDVIVGGLKTFVPEPIKGVMEGVEKGVELPEKIGGWHEHLTND